MHIVLVVICLVIVVAIYRVHHLDAKATGLAPLTRNQLRTMRRKARQQGVPISQVKYKPRRKPYR